jgi:hypothetical protein
MVPSFTRWRQDVIAQQQVEGPDHVRVLGLGRLLAVRHRERRRGLLAVVDDAWPGLDDHSLEVKVGLDLT